MDVDKILSIGAGVLISIGVLGLGLFAMLQDIDVRQSVENWANENNLQPVIELVELLTN